MQQIFCVLLSFCLCLSGLKSELAFLFHPEAYSTLTLEVEAEDLPSPVTQVAEDSYVSLSEVEMHYRVFGSGEQAVILIHGNGANAYALEEVATYLAHFYTVYLPESRCQGSSSDPGEISYRLMAQDLKEFVDALKIESPILIGHSDGGINAITFAAEYPDVPGAIISCGANSKPAAFKPLFTLNVKLANLSRRDKLNDLMLTEPHFTPEYLAQITCPAYIVSAQYDIMWIADTCYIAACIGGSDMAILKGEDHSSYIAFDGKKGYALVSDWLQKKGLLESNSPA